MSCHAVVCMRIPAPRLTRPDPDRSKTATSWPARCRSAAATLAELGARRVSLGSLLYRRALAAAVTTATTIRDGWPTDFRTPSYAEVQALGAPDGTPRRSR